MKSLFIAAIIFCCSIICGQESYIDSSKIKDPAIAWKLSIIPGVGQIYNDKWLKAIGLIGVEYYALNKYIEFNRTDKIRKRNTFSWWIIGVWVYGMLDAYVDAQLSTFPVLTVKQDSLLSNERTDQVQ